MEREEVLTRKIEDLRTNLETVIKEKGELINPEVVKASESMDKVLLQYYGILDMGGDLEY